MWACVDSNHGPLHYQCSALTTWATSPIDYSWAVSLQRFTLYLTSLSCSPVYLLILSKWYDNKPLRKPGRSRKEVFQPHLPVRLPCYDLAPVAGLTLNSSSRLLSSGPPNSHGLTGGVYKVRERIHRIIADMRLLAIPASWGRVADLNPNWDALFVIGLLLPVRNTLYAPL
jgi:hypothetical protein